jgi:predicted MFS family arabinose efflux permease/HAMP domain-containing protein
VTAALLQRLSAILVAASVALLLACVGIVSGAALSAFEREVRPSLEQEASALGRVVAAPIETALSLGVPLAALPGVEPYFETMLAGRPGVAWLVLAAADGTPMVRAGAGAASFEPAPPDAAATRRLAAAYDTRLRLGPAEDAPAAFLHVGMSRAPLEAAIADTRWDVLIVMLVGAILAVELLRYVLDRTVTSPLAAADRLAQRLQAGDLSAAADSTAPDEAGRLARLANALVRRLNDRRARLDWLAQDVATAGAAATREAAAVLARVAARARFGRGTAEASAAGPATARLPLFLFVAAEQLSTSFIPLFGRDLARAGGAADPGMLAALAIAAFVAAVALATPAGGRMAARRGPRATILAGCAIAALGFLGAALSTSIWAFILARLACGVGYALVSIACQSQMVAIAPRGRLAGTLGGFTGAVMTGAVCGTAIGAVLADRIGQGPTFLVSAALVLAVLVLAARSFPRGAGPEEAVPIGFWAEARLALRAPAFLALLLLAAVPAKLVLAGFVFYLAPIALNDLGLSQSAVGRYVMLYGFCMLPAIALGGWIADRTRLGPALIWGAAVANGAALALPFAMPLDLALPVAIAVTGLAQGLASAPMLAAVAASARPSDGATAPVLLAFLRLGERLGSMIGPFVAAFVLAGAGMAEALASIALVSAATGIVYAIAMLLHRAVRPAMRAAS